MGKIIAITGTDCSGKETQTKKLMENLGKIGYKVTYDMYLFQIILHQPGK